MKKGIKLMWVDKPPLLKSINARMTIVKGKMNVLKHVLDNSQSDHLKNI